MICSERLVPALLLFLLLFCIRLMLTVASQKAELLKQENLLVWYREQLRRFAYLKFVDKSQQIEGQIIMPGLFDVEQKKTENDTETEKTTTVTVHTHHRRKRGRNMVNLYSEFLDEIVEEYYPKDICCMDCLGQMEEIGTKERRLLTIIPAKVCVIRQISHTFRCRKCKVAAREPLNVVSGILPAPLFPGSYTTPEFIAHIGIEKLLMGEPLYRQEKLLRILGIPLSRQTMDNWLFKAAELLKPVWERLGYWIKQVMVIHIDETPVLVIHTEERNGKKKKCYVWVYRSRRYEEHQVIFFDFHDGRTKDDFKSFIKDYSGYIITDGCNVYHNNSELVDITVIGCWNHAYAKFADTAKFGDDRNEADTPARQAIGIFKKFFNLEKELKDLEPEERLTERLRRIKPMTDKLRIWLDSKKDTVLPRSLLGKAINYALNNWQYLTGIFETGRADATNSAAERAIKDFVMARRNFLFANVEKGAEVLAIFESLIGSAYGNSLDPEKYLTWLLKRIGSIDTTNMEALDTLMPWNAPDDCKIPAARRIRQSESQSNPQPAVPA